MDKVYFKNECTIRDLRKFINNLPSNYDNHIVLSVGDSGMSYDIAEILPGGKDGFLIIPRSDHYEDPYDD